MRRRSFLMLVPLTAAGCLQKPFHFVQMADTQLGMIEGGEDGVPFDAETAILERVVDGINALNPRPAFVVVCGDMTNLPFHKAEIAEYKLLMGRLNPDIPYYNVSGNHDFAGNPTAETIARYTDIYGADRYAFDYNGWHFLILNSSLMKFPEDAPDEAAAQRSWAESDLLGAVDMRGTIVFMHHPFFDKSIDEEDGYHSITKAYRREWLDLFAANNVKAVFSGHRHTTIPEHEWEGVKLVNTNAICNSFDDSPGLRIVRIDNSGLRHTFHGTDALPGGTEASS